jgi:hypothetical protein
MHFWLKRSSGFKTVTEQEVAQVMAYVTEPEKVRVMEHVMEPETAREWADKATVHVMDPVVVQAKVSVPVTAEIAATVPDK